MTRATKKRIETLEEQVEDLRDMVYVWIKYNKRPSRRRVLVGRARTDLNEIMIALLNRLNLKVVFKGNDIKVYAARTKGKQGRKIRKRSKK
jgi:hypothetical protein